MTEFHIVGVVCGVSLSYCHGLLGHFINVISNTCASPTMTIQNACCENTPQSGPADNRFWRPKPISIFESSYEGDIQTMRVAGDKSRKYTIRGNTHVGTHGDTRMHVH